MWAERRNHITVAVIFRGLEAGDTALRGLRAWQPPARGRIAAMPESVSDHQPTPDGVRAAPSILIVAGEASGDLHGASLAHALREAEPDVELFGVGGDRMKDRGVDLVYHMRRLAVMGIMEVVSHLGDIRRALNTLSEVAVDRHVDAVVLIDYPDFNMTLARRLRRRLPDVPIVYYISPQVWAWRSRRIKSIARMFDLMLVILPFERDLYASTDLEVEFVGHPLLDVIEFGDDRAAFAERHGPAPTDTWIGLLPGSRRIEVDRLLAPMLEAAEQLTQWIGRPQFLVPTSPSLDRTLYERILAGHPRLEERVFLVDDDYYATLEHCSAAAVCSGTATLEATLMDTPMVVVYRTSWLTYNLAKSLVRVRDIALVNLIAGRRAVPELVQGEVTGPHIAEELRTLLNKKARRDAVLDALAEVRQRLGDRGASRRAAAAVLRAAGCTEPSPVSSDSGDSGDPIT